jgi:hypothetical protein
MNYFKNELFVFGGTNGFEYYKDIYKFDLINCVWSKVQVIGKEPEV